MRRRQLAEVGLGTPRPSHGHLPTLGAGGGQEAVFPTIFTQREVPGKGVGAAGKPGATAAPAGPQSASSGSPGEDVPGPLSPCSPADSGRGPSWWTKARALTA